MNCMPGDIAYFCMNIPSEEENPSMVGMAMRAMRGRAVVILAGDYDRGTTSWLIKPVDVEREERGMILGTTVYRVADSSVRPIAGMSRHFLLNGEERE